MTEADIDAMIENMRRQQAWRSRLWTGRRATDRVVIDYQTRLEGKPSRMIWADVVFVLGTRQAMPAPEQGSAARHEQRTVTAAFSGRPPEQAACGRKAPTCISP